MVLLRMLAFRPAVPLHEPLRLAEELAMLDCLSNGRLIAGVARGAPREYKIFGVSMSESRSRFEEAFEVMRRAWMDESFSFEGKHYRYEDVSIWPRPVQNPHPPVWVPVTGSRETVEWAAAHDLTITPGVFAGPMREDSIRYFSKCMAGHGRKVTPRHISIMVDCYVADSKQETSETIEWEDGNTYPMVRVEISSASHPFYTGRQILVDTGGRVERFRKRYGRESFTTEEGSETES
jgi:ribosomal protein L31